MVNFDHVGKNLKIMFRAVDVNQFEYLLIENKQFKFVIKCISITVQFY